MQEQKKSYFVQGNLSQTSPDGPLIWKVMQRNMCEAILRAGEWNNSTVTQSRNTMPWWPPTQGRRNGICWRGCQQYALELFWCLYLTRIGRPDILWWVTNLLEQSLNGPELATDAWFVGFHTFITHLICDNIFMWETRLSIVDWVCSKTRALLETLKTQNQPWGKSYVSSEVEHLFP